MNNANISMLVTYLNLCASKIENIFVLKIAKKWTEGSGWSYTSVHWLRRTIYRQTSKTSQTFVGNKLVGQTRSIWSIACRRCSNYIFILDLTPSFSGCGKDDCKTRRETFKFWDLVRLTLNVYDRMNVCPCKWLLSFWSDWSKTSNTILGQYIFQHQFNILLTFLSGLFTAVLCSKDLPILTDVITMTSYRARWYLQSPGSRLFTQAVVRAQIKEASKLRITGFCEGKSPVVVEFPAKGPVTRIMFPFDDVIMAIYKMAVNKLIRNSHGIWVHWKCSVLLVIEYVHIMMTSSNGNIFCVAGPLPGEFTGHRWILSQRPVARSFDVFFDLRVE